MTRPCARCGHPHTGNDSNICVDCWVELGQMSFWDDDYSPATDTFFDREEEARGYQ
jgi:hypothetical protein